MPFQKSPPALPRLTESDIREAPSTTLKSGLLSAYGFRCGYVQERSFPGNGGGRVYMYQEHGAYHVRFGPPDIAANVPQWSSFNTSVWNSFDKLGEARQEYRRQCRNAQKRWKEYTGN